MKIDIWKRQAGRRAPESGKLMFPKLVTPAELKTSIAGFERRTRVGIKTAKKLVLPVPRCLAFSTRDLSVENVRKIASGVLTGGRMEDVDSKFIYLFRLSAKNSVSNPKMIAAFLAARELQISGGGKSNLCKLNPGAEKSDTIYVGRCDLARERIKGHLGASESGAYALHFQTWALRLNLKIDLQLYQLRGVEDPVVQIVEDGLWDHFKPVFGRRGER